MRLSDEARSFQELNSDSDKLPSLIENVSQACVYVIR